MFTVHIMYTRFLCLIYTSRKRYLEAICNLFSLPTHSCLIHSVPLQCSSEYCSRTKPNSWRTFKHEDRRWKGFHGCQNLWGVRIICIALFLSSSSSGVSWRNFHPFHPFSKQRLRLKKKSSFFNRSILFFQSVRSSYLNFKLIIILEFVPREDFLKQSLWLQSDFIFSERFLSWLSFALISIPLHFYNSFFDCIFSSIFPTLKNVGQKVSRLDTRLV